MAATETMSPREKVFREVLNAVFSGFEHGQCEKEWEAPYGKEIASLATDAILETIASSGDHAELVASLRKPEIWQSYPGPEGDFETRLAPFDAATAIEALVAEVAALRGENERIRVLRHQAIDRSRLWEIDAIKWETRATEAERKLAEAVDDERARGQAIIHERDRWIVDLIRECDEAKAILRDAVSEAVPDAMIFAGHPDEQRYSKALDGLRIWTDRARTFLSKEAERGLPLPPAPGAEA